MLMDDILTDVIVKFINEKCIDESYIKCFFKYGNGHETTRQLYEKFVKFTGNKIGQKVFNEKLVEMGYEKRRTHLGLHFEYLMTKKTFLFNAQFKSISKNATINDEMKKDLDVLINKYKKEKKLKLSRLLDSLQHNLHEDLINYDNLTAIASKLSIESNFDSNDILKLRVYELTLKCIASTKQQTNFYFLVYNNYTTIKFTEYKTKNLNSKKILYFISEKTDTDKWINEIKYLCRRIHQQNYFRAKNYILVSIN